MAEINQLYRIKTQFDDWPEGLSEADKKWCQEKAEVLLSNATITVGEAAHFLFTMPDCPEVMRRSALSDWQYAVAERALRAADGQACYTKRIPFRR